MRVESPAAHILLMSEPAAKTAGATNQVVPSSLRSSLEMQTPDAGLKAGGRLKA
jgi:hypothetical protein